MKFKLVEHYVNCFGKNEQEEYFEDVKRLIENAYAPIGGAKGIDNPKELMGDDIFWKLDRRNGKIVACAIYKIKGGKQGMNKTVNMFDPDATNRKLKYVGQDGTSLGKHCLMNIIREDIEQAGRGFWAEVSDKMEIIYINKGAIPIPNIIAKEILKAAGKPIDELDSDGYHYYRRIGSGDEPHRKMIVGNADIVNQSKYNNPDLIYLFDNAPEYKQQH